MRRVLSLIFDFRLEIVAFFVGLVILAFELTAARIVAPYLGATIYVWTSIIGVILAALAAGYALGGVWADRRDKTEDVVWLILVAAFCIAFINVTKDWLLDYVGASGLSLQLQAFVSSLLLFAFPTVLLGAVSPYLARLNITEVATSGRKLSRINAAGTLGSLVGTFLTGYVLFGFIGSRHLLWLLALCLVGVSFLLKPKKLIYARLALLVLLLLLALFSSAPRLSGFFSEVDTAYSRVIVRDIDYRGQQVRVLQTDSEGLQSGVYANGDPGLVFDYARAFAYASELMPEGQKYLVIGGGAYTFPEYLAKKTPEAIVDTVEIDDQLAGISKRYFNFTPPPNLHIINADGRQFLNHTEQHYDMIFLDAFNSIVPPFQLLTAEAAAQMDRALTDEGIVVANFISAAEGPRAQLIKAARNTFRTVFPYVAVYQVTPVPLTDTQNLLLLAAKEPINDKNTQIVSSRYSEFADILQTKLRLDNDNQLSLTDDFAPIERLVLP